jgi:hypothetical protein
MIIAHRLCPVKATARSTDRRNTFWSNAGPGRKSVSKKRRCGLSAAQKASLWQRWKDGESLSDIGRSLGKHAASIHAIVRPNGGIMPAVRKRAPRALTLAEREEISRGIHADVSIRQIAPGLGRSPSTVSREVARHGGLDKYRATLADARAWERAKRPKPCRLAVNAKLCRLVARKLQLNWLKLQYPDDETMQVSHETIYRSLFIQARGVLKAELMKLPAHAPDDAPFEESVDKGTTARTGTRSPWSSINDPERRWAS